MTIVLSLNEVCIISIGTAVVILYLNYVLAYKKQIVPILMLLTASIEIAHGLLLVHSV